MKILALILVITGAAWWTLVLSGLTAAVYSATRRSLDQRRARRQPSAGQFDAAVRAYAEALDRAERWDVLTTMQNKEDGDTR